MMNKALGFSFLAIYILAVGTGSFLQKFVMGKVSPYQLEVITAIGMFIVSVPALFIVQRSLYVPIKSAPLALAVGLLFSIGSFVYTGRIYISYRLVPSTGPMMRDIAVARSDDDGKTFKTLGMNHDGWELNAC